jgi:hypothetical protein
MNEMAGDYIIIRVDIVVTVSVVEGGSHEIDIHSPLVKLFARCPSHHNFKLFIHIFNRFFIRNKFVNDQFLAVKNWRETMWHFSIV